LRLSLIQSSSSAINSIYILHDFMDNTQYKNFLCEKIKNYTLVDTMDKSTNVQASMTSWRKLLEDSDFNNLHIKILETLGMIFTLRNPHPEEKYSFYYQDSWGMSHQKGDLTFNHVHAESRFSGAFYLDVPCPTDMFFDDYDQKVTLKSNMLLLFPGLCKHKVEKNVSDKKRISMAFNINFERTDKEK